MFTEAWRNRIKESLQPFVFLLDPWRRLCILFYPERYFRFRTHFHEKFSIICYTSICLHIQSPVYCKSIGGKTPRGTLGVFSPKLADPCQNNTVHPLPTTVNCGKVSLIPWRVMLIWWQMLAGACSEQVPTTFHTQTDYRDTGTTPTGIISSQLTG